MQQRQVIGYGDPWVWVQQIYLLLDELKREISSSAVPCRHVGC